MIQIVTKGVGMLKKSLGLLFLLTSFIASYAHDNAHDHLVSITIDKNIVITFDLPIDKDSIKRRTVELKKITRHEEERGEVSVKEKTLFFIPKKGLEEGYYLLQVAPLKLKKCERHENWFVRMFIKDRCTLTTRPIHYKFQVDDQPKIVSFDFNQTDLHVKEGTNVLVQVNALYDDNSTKDVTQNVDWSVGDASIITIQDGNVSALKEGKTTLEAAYNGLSQEQNVTVYKEVNGHILPLEPDKTVNNSTLLGVDANYNGVRDDVERWIYLEMKIYNGYEKIEQAIAMQQAKANQMALVDPANDEVNKAMTAGMDCWEWYSYSRKLPLNDGIMKFGNALDDKCFNTKERLKTYMEYDNTLRGRVFTDTPTLQTKSQCETDIDGL